VAREDLYTAICEYCSGEGYSSTEAGIIGLVFSPEMSMQTLEEALEGRIPCPICAGTGTITKCLFHEHRSTACRCDEEEPMTPMSSDEAMIILSEQGFEQVLSWVRDVHDTFYTCEVGDTPAYSEARWHMVEKAHLIGIDSELSRALWTIFMPTIESMASRHRAIERHVRDSNTKLLVECLMNIQPV